MKTLEQPKVSEFLAMAPEVEKKSSNVERIPIHLSEEDRKNLKVSPEELNKMKPDELTDKQWSVVKRLIDETAKNLYTVKFENLFPGQKIGVIRCLISPNEKEGQELGMEYEKEKNCTRQQKLSQT